MLCLISAGVVFKWISTYFVSFSRGPKVLVATLISEEALWSKRWIHFNMKSLLALANSLPLDLWCTGAMEQYQVNKPTVSPSKFHRWSGQEFGLRRFQSDLFIWGATCSFAWLWKLAVPVSDFLYCCLYRSYFGVIESRGGSQEASQSFERSLGVDTSCRLFGWWQSKCFWSIDGSEDCLMGRSSRESGTTALGCFRSFGCSDPNWHLSLFEACMSPMGQYLATIDDFQCYFVSKNSFCWQRMSPECMGCRISMLFAEVLFPLQAGLFGFGTRWAALQGSFREHLEAAWGLCTECG